MSTPVAWMSHIPRNDAYLAFITLIRPLCFQVCHDNRSSSTFFILFHYISFFPLSRLLRLLILDAIAITNESTESYGEINRNNIRIKYKSQNINIKIINEDILKRRYSYFQFSSLTSTTLSQKILVLFFLLQNM